jgi:predicted transcriptional regulator
MNYWKYSRYAKHFSEYLSGDIVHDLYLRYFLRHGRNIFEEKFSNRQIWIAVRNQYLNMVRTKNRYIETITKESDDPDSELVDFFDELPSEDVQVVEIMIAAELDAMFREQLLSAVVSHKRHESLLISDKNIERGHNILEVYKLMTLNYRNIEIAQELGISEQVVGNYKKQIIGNMAKNPFNGDKTKVRGVITQKVWRTRKNKDRRKQYELVDLNEYYELYKHKETGVGLLVRLEIKDGPNPYLLKN